MWPAKFFDKTDMFTSSDGTKNFRINSFINCSTTRVVYVLTCPCGTIYVGKTKRQLKVRVGEHIQTILKKTMNVPYLFTLLDYITGTPRDFYLRESIN